MPEKNSADLHRLSLAVVMVLALATSVSTVSAQQAGQLDAPPPVARIVYAHATILAPAPSAGRPPLAPGRELQAVFELLGTRGPVRRNA